MLYCRLRARAPLFTVLLFAVLAVGCGSTRPVRQRPAPPPPPIEVNGEALPPIAFANVKLDIADHVALGYHHVGAEYARDFEYRWGPNFKDETDKLNGTGQALLAEAGYRVVADDSAALHLVGTLGGLGYDSYAFKAGFEQAECAVTWELYRHGEGKPCFTARTTGAGRVEAGQMGAIIAAFELALRRLLAAEDFVTAVQRESGP